MLTLLSECHLWTLRDEVRNDTIDFSAFRYTRSRDVPLANLKAQAKRDYTESRCGIVVPKNDFKGSGRVKTKVKKLENLLRSQRVVYSQWQGASVILLLLSSGLICHICVDIYTGDILRIAFEKFLVGKLAAEFISDAFFTSSYIVLSYNTNQLTVVHLQKTTAKRHRPQKILDMDPRIFHVLIPGPSDRKLCRQLAVNSSSDLFISWTQSSQNEVYPWRPTIRDQDRANIHIFKLKSSKLDSISYCWTENDPLHVEFLRSTESRILSVEQKVCHEGKISAEICLYEINTGKMHGTTLTSIAVGAQICCCSFSPDQEKLFLGTIDRLVCLHDLIQQSTKFMTRTDIVPTHCSWHSDSTIIMVANDRSHFQCFDLALSSVAIHLQKEDTTTSTVLDISHYFNKQPTLIRLAFSGKPDVTNFPQNYAQTDSFLLLIFEHGPVGCLRFFAGSGMKGDIHNSGLTADVFVDKYLNLDQLEKAVNLLVALNWETYGAMCLISLHKIANYIFFRGEFARSRTELMSKAFKTFTDTLSEETKDEFGDQVFDLRRRFFFYLLRNKCYADCFDTAQDIEDYDLFMDLHNVAKASENFVLASTCFDLALALLQEEDGDHEDDSNSGDSQSNSTYSEYSCTNVTPLKQRNQFGEQLHDTKTRFFLKYYVPPLPSFKSNIVNAETIKINIPKPELRYKINQKRDRQLTCNQNCQHLEAIGISPDFVIDQKNCIKTKRNHENGLDQNVPAQTKSVQSIPSIPVNPHIPLLRNNVLPCISEASTAVPKIVATNSKHITFRTQQPKHFYHYPLISGSIPPTSNFPNGRQDIKKRLQKKPTVSILSNGSSYQSGCAAATNIFNDLNMSLNSRDMPSKAVVGEKNKVKFSDTVQVALVPENPRKENPKIFEKKNGLIVTTSRNITNPKKELADSLPLCHPNDDYLKDFNPISTCTAWQNNS